MNTAGAIVAVVSNPSSGGRRAAARRGVALERLAERGVNMIRVTGRSACDTTVRVTEAVAHGVDAVVAMGGDGVISAVVQALATTPVPMGIIPAGTGNDLARELAIPRDPSAAADVVVDGVTRAIDLGRLRPSNSTGEAWRWFATVVASGFDSRVAHRANTLRRPRGVLRYPLALAAELPQLRPIGYRIDIDPPNCGSGARVLEVEAFGVAVGNARFYGGGMMICPTAVLDDNLLDITVIDSRVRRNVFRLLPDIYRGTHIDLANVSTFRTRRVVLSFDNAANDVGVHADGEPVGKLPVSVVSAEDALRVIVPPNG